MTSWLDTLTTLKAPVLAVVLCVCLLPARADAQTSRTFFSSKKFKLRQRPSRLADPIPLGSSRLRSRKQAKSNQSCSDWLILSISSMTHPSSTFAAR